MSAHVRPSRVVSRSVVSNSGLAFTECGLDHAVLRETQEEPLDKPLPNHVVDFCSPLFLEGCVALFSQDVVDAAHSQTFSGEGKFRLRVLTWLNSFVHGSNDICLGRKLVVVVRQRL